MVVYCQPPIGYLLVVEPARRLLRIAASLSRVDQNGAFVAFLKPDLTPPAAVAQVEGWILGIPRLIRTGKGYDMISGASARFAFQGCLAYTKQIWSRQSKADRDSWALPARQAVIYARVSLQGATEGKASRSRAQFKSS